MNQQYIPGDSETLADFYRSVTADRELVVLLDDAASSAQVGPLVCAAPRALTLVTSREPLTGLVQTHGAALERIPALGDRDCRDLLARIAGLERAQSDADRAAALDAVARECRGVPLSVRRAGAQLAAGATLGDRSAQREGTGETASGNQAKRWTEPDAEARQTDRAVVTAPAAPPVEVDLLGGYRDVPAEAARLHRLLSVHPWPSISAGPAAAAAGLADLATAASLLARLYRANLLERAPGGGPGAPRYRMHERVRAQAGGLAIVQDGLAAVVSSLSATLAWYTDFAVEADFRVIDRWHIGPRYEALRADAAARLAAEVRYPTDTAAIAALEAERSNLVDAAVLADQHGLADLSWQLAEACWSLFFRLGLYEDWITVYRLGVKGAVGAGNRKAEGRMRTALAFGFLGQGRWTEAEMELTAALEAVRTAGHVTGEATVLESLGLACLARERYLEAADFFAAALVPAEREQDPRALALLQHHIGRALSGQERFDEALAQLERALAAMRALPAHGRPADPYNEARVLMSLGEAQVRAGRPEAARSVLEQARQIMAQRNAVVQQAQVAVLSAWCARERGDLDAERAFLVQAQEFHARTGAPGYAGIATRLSFLEAAQSRFA